MSSPTETRTAISPTPPAMLRLRLQPDGPACTRLDGGWWPRSADPAAELPGLVVALDERHGPVSKIMLGVADWDSSRPGRLRVDGPAGRRMLRLGWSPAMPAGLLTAIYADGHRTDLLIVPRIPVSRRPRRPWHKPHRSATVHRPGPGTGLIFLCA